MSIYSLFLILFLVQDPIGNIPSSINLLRQIPNHRHTWFIVRENLIAFFIACFFLMSGTLILDYLSVDPSVFGITGGILLLVMAFQMVFFSQGILPSEPSSLSEPFVVPLAIPLLAGPSLIATIIYHAAEKTVTLPVFFMILLMLSILSTVILLLAVPVHRYITPTLLQAFEKVVGILLMAMALQMIIDGLFGYSATYTARSIQEYVTEFAKALKESEASLISSPKFDEVTKEAHVIKDALQKIMHSLLSD